MMGTIRGIPVILTCLLLAGCSMRKQSTYERTALHSGKVEMTRQERQLRQQERTTAASIRMAYAYSMAEINPVGTFRLNPDSGFIGRAERVVISQKNRNLRVTTSGVVTSKTDSLVATAATREYTAAQRDTRMEHRKADVSSPLKIPWWVWLCSICGAIYLAMQFWKR